MIKTIFLILLGFGMAKAGMIVRRAKRWKD